MFKWFWTIFSLGAPDHESLTGPQIPKPRILDSTSKHFLDSEIRITFHGAKYFYKCYHVYIFFDFVLIVFMVERN